MSTGEKYLSITQNRILGYDSFKTNLLDYLMNQTNKLASKTYRTSGFFQAVSLAADGNDKFQITGYPTSDVAGIDGVGAFLDPDARPTDVAAIQFENTLSQTYEVGIQRALVPSGLTISTLDGVPSFNTYEEIIGFEGTPNAVVDNLDGTLTFTVTSVCEASVTFAGRKVKVWKLVPGIEALTESISVEECTVAYTGGANKITTVANFGQGATPSTTAAHYRIALVGPRVLRDSTLIGDPTAAFVGTITGSGAGTPPATFSTVGQNVIDFPISDLWQITRYVDISGTDRLKVEVKSIAAESGVHQIRVKNHLDVVKFSVDEAGNVEIKGNLDVLGTETVHDVETIQSTQVITGNLEAGDAAADNHKIKGTWWHTNVAESATYLKVDGTTGKVGIGDTFNALYALQVTGDLGVNGDCLPTAGSGAKLLGKASFEWNGRFWEFQTRTGMFRSTAPAIYLYEDGAATNKKSWEFRADAGELDLYFLEDEGGGGGFTKFLKVERVTGYTVGALHLLGDFLPMTNNTYNLGSVTGPKYWKGLYLQYCFFEPTSPVLVPLNDAEFCIGTDNYRPYQIEAFRFKVLAKTGDGVGAKIEMTDLVASDTNQRRWDIKAENDGATETVFSVNAVTSGGVGSPAFTINRSAGVPSYLNLYCDLRPNGTRDIGTTTVPFTNTYSKTLYAYHSTVPAVRLRATGVTNVDAEIWEILNSGSATGGELVIRAIDNSEGVASTFLTVYRNAGDLKLQGEARMETHLRTKNASGGDPEWNIGIDGAAGIDDDYLWKRVCGQHIVAAGDLGAGLTTGTAAVEITNGMAPALGTGDCNVKSLSGIGTPNSSHWLKFYYNSSTFYIPVFSTIT